MDNHNKIQARKAALRKIYLEKRCAISTEQKSDFDRRLVDALLKMPQYHNAKLIFCTISTLEEVDTAPIIEAARISGKQVALPCCMPGHHLRFYYYDVHTIFERSRFGILEPIASSRIVSNYDESICIVPALCCDTDRYRIGYGGGYFDRFLSGYTGFSVTLLYPGFITEEPLPREATDIPVNSLIVP